MSVPELLLIAASFFTSALTATIGIGGGVLLISLMPALLPAAAVIPVHGVVQLASNLSRTALAVRHVEWSLLAPYAGGAILGAALGSPVAVGLPSWTLPTLLGLFVILVTWAPLGGLVRRCPGRFFSIGAVQTFVSLFVGAPGPLVTPLLLQERIARDRIVVTHASMMSILHTIKVAVFVGLGISLVPYLRLLVAMIVAVTLGSLVGTRLRSRLPEKRFRSALKWVLTALALRLLISALPT